MEHERSDLPQVFVSHSHEDNLYCREFVRGLRAQDMTVWYDEHNLGWGQLRQTIDRELQRCQHFIAILSPSAVASAWVNLELDAALAQLRRGKLETFLLVVAQRCDIPLTLEGFKRLEAPGGKAIDVDDAVRRVTQVINDSRHSRGSLPTQVEDMPARPTTAMKIPSPIASEEPLVGMPEAYTNLSLLSPVEEASVSPATGEASPSPVVSGERAIPQASDHTIKSPIGYARTVRLFLGGIFVMAVLAVLGVLIAPMIFNAPPNADFGHSNPYDKGVLGEPSSICVDFSANWSPFSSSPAYTWDFGEQVGGSESTDQGAQVTHCYLSPGTYNVVLTVQDAKGRQASSQQTVDVYLSST